MNGQPDGRPTWGNEGERPGAPRAEDQLRDQGVSQPTRRRMTVEGISTWVDQSIQQAQRQGAFDDLPGAGKPLREVDTTTDPDWWVKGLIEREKLDLADAMPGVMQLRREKAALPETLQAFTDEEAVRAHLEDFNERVLADRRRPHAGPHPPPVVGRVDVEEQVEVWREQRAAAAASPEPVAEMGSGAKPEEGVEPEAGNGPPAPTRLSDRRRRGLRGARGPRLGTLRWWGQTDR